MKYIITFLLFVINSVAMACPVCEKQQPTITRGITHGAGPTGTGDWIIIITMCIITLAVLFYSIKFIFRPGEQNSDHIKNSIIQTE